MAFKDNAVELEERVVAINRVTKVVKGGRNMRFAAPCKNQLLRNDYE